MYLFISNSCGRLLGFLAYFVISFVIGQPGSDPRECSFCSHRSVGDSGCDTIPHTMNNKVRHASFSSDMIGATFSPPSPEVAKATIREMARFTWLNYRHLAFGHDEITPDDGKPRDNWGLHAVTLVDALSTLWIMDLKFEFREGVDFFGAIFSRLMSSRSGLRSLFELNIRLLGGLLGAHSLCFDKDPSYATKLLGYATEVGTRFLPAFRERVLPCEMIEISSGKIACRDSGIVLAQMGSFSLEFRYLSYHSGNPIFKELADRTMEAIMMANDRGLVSNRLSLSNRTAPLFLQRVVEQGQRWSLGANGDSYYEQVNGVIKCDVRFCTYVITVFICISRGLCFQVSAEDVSVVLSTIRGRDVFA